MMGRGIVVTALLVILSFGIACDEQEIAKKLDRKEAVIDKRLDDIEIPDIYEYLNDTTWTVKNKTGDACYEGFDAQITFGPEGTAVLDHGRIAALGMAEITVFTIEDITFDIMQGPTALFKWKMVGGITFEYSTVIDVHFDSTDKMTWIGCGGWGEANCVRASILRRVGEYGEEEDR